MSDIVAIQMRCADAEERAALAEAEVARLRAELDAALLHIRVLTGGPS